MRLIWMKMSCVLVKMASQNSLKKNKVVLPGNEKCFFIQYKEANKAFLLKSPVSQVPYYKRESSFLQYFTKA